MINKSVNHLPIHVVVFLTNKCSKHYVIQAITPNIDKAKRRLSKQQKFDFENELNFI